MFLPAMCIAFIFGSLISCGGGSMSAPIAQEPYVAPIAAMPAREYDRIERGKRIFNETMKRFSFTYKKPIVNGLCVDVVIPFPQSAWNKLNAKEKVDLAIFSQDTVFQVKGQPREYVEMSNSAPLYPTCIQNINKMSQTAWRIEVGSVVTIDRDRNIGPDADTVVGGNSIAEFRQKMESK